MTRRVLRALAMVVLALALAPIGASAQEAPKKKPLDLTLGEEFVAAWRAGDEPEMQKLAQKSVELYWVDPYYVVRTYLLEHAEATLADPPRPSDALEAARAFAALAGKSQRNAALPGLVEEWARLDEAGKRDELEVQRAWKHFEDPEFLKDTPRAHAEYLRLGPIADAHPRSMAATILRAVLAAWHGSAVGSTREVELDFVAAAAAAERLPWPRGQGRGYWDAGRKAWARGEIAAARAYWERTAAVFEQSADPRLLAFSLRDIAEAYETLGEYGTALTFAERSLAIAEALNDGYILGLTMITVGRIQGELGQLARSLSQLERAVRQLRDVSPDVLGLSYAHAELAKTCARLGLTARAVEAAGEGVRCIDLLKHSNFSRSAAEVRTAACEALVEVGRLDEAAAFIEQARATLEKAGDLPAAADALARLGELRAQQGQLDLAVDAFEHVLAETESMGSRGPAARTRAALGRVLARRSPGDTERAAALCRSAHGELTAFGDRAGASRALLVLAGLERVRGRAPEALALARRAIEMQLAVGMGLGEDEAAGLRREARAAADEGMLAAIALAAGGQSTAIVADAFWFAESSRGLLLAEGIANREALLAAAVPEDVRRADTDARARVAVLRDRLAEVAAKPDASPEELASARAALDGAYEGLEAAVARVQREARRVADVVYPHPVTLAQAQASLDAETTFVLYHLAGSRALAVVLTNDSARLTDLGDADALRRAVQDYVDLVSVDGSDEAGKAAALYDALLRPLEAETMTRRRIVVSPDGPLTFLPFDALVRRDGAVSARVVERWETGCAPSATVRALLAAPRGRDSSGRGRGLVALGDPVYPREGAAASAQTSSYGSLRRVPGTAAEVRALAELLPPGGSTLLLRDAATVGQLTAALARAPGRLAAVHLACHGRVDAERPRLTGLVLTGGELLSVDDVYRMRIPADLVVLSACDSGQGRILDGEGVTGLARAFFFAGAARVVASNWAVSDEATRALMVSFYARMLSDGVAPGAALREAKLAALRAGGPAAHPAHWAAFVNWGE